MPTTTCISMRPINRHGGRCSAPASSTPRRRNYDKGWKSRSARRRRVRRYPRRAELGALPRLDLIDAEKHRIVADAYAEHAPLVPARRGQGRRVKYARDGEMCFGFEPREIHAERCQEVEIVLDNTDEVRHDLMILGLNPLFALNVLGPDVASARFVTPDQDITLPFHCHVAMHEKAGMAGRLIVGGGSQRLAQAGQTAPEAATPETVAPEPAPPATPTPGVARPPVHGVGTVIAALPRLNRLIVNHGELPGFMPAMEMSYAVNPSRLLDGLNHGDKIEFTIDPATASIIELKVIEAVK